MELNIRPLLLFFLTSKTYNAHEKTSFNLRVIAECSK